MTLPYLRVFAVLGVLAAVAAARADDVRPAVQDDAHLFDEEAVRQASAELHDIGRTYGLDFFLKTVDEPSPDVQKKLETARDAVQKNEILHKWAADEADSHAVCILVCKNVVRGWFDRAYGCVVITVPDESRSDKFTAADARALHDRLRWFTRGTNKAKNDAILLAAVKQMRDDLYYNHLPPFPWLGVGGVMAGVLGLWGVLGLVRMRLRSADAAAGAPEPGRPGLFAALLGGMFGGVPGHWIYDTLFVAASRSRTPAEETAAPLAAEGGPKAAPVEAAEPPTPTKAERLDFAARDHPTEEEPAAPESARL